jgi:hypothetical protein
MFRHLQKWIGDFSEVDKRQIRIHMVDKKEVQHKLGFHKRPKPSLVKKDRPARSTVDFFPSQDPSDAKIYSGSKSSRSICCILSVAAFCCWLVYYKGMTVNFM